MSPDSVPPNATEPKIKKAKRQQHPRRPDTRTWAEASDGLVIIDKPQGWSSHDVVSKTRYFARMRKVGHAGTLDPMATGVLVVGVGKATRLLTYLVGADKEYLATIRLGEATLTDDAEGEFIAQEGAEALDRAVVLDEISKLTGDILQVPTAISAIKVDGKRSYARVRAGEEVELAARPVTVSRFEILDFRPTTSSAGTAVVDVDVVVECTSGTYIRALARDLGDALSTGGHLIALRRTRVGGFALEKARTIEDLAEVTEVAGQLPVQSLAAAASTIFPVREITSEQATLLVHGQFLEPTGARGIHCAMVGQQLIALLEDGRRAGERLAKPVIVFGPVT